MAYSITKQCRRCKKPFNMTFESPEAIGDYIGLDLTICAPCEDAEIEAYIRQNTSGFDSERIPHCAWCDREGHTITACPYQLS